MCYSSNRSEKFLKNPIFYISVKGLFVESFESNKVGYLLLTYVFLITQRNISAQRMSAQELSALLIICKLCFEA